MSKEDKLLQEISLLIGRYMEGAGIEESEADLLECLELMYQELVFLRIYKRLNEKL